MPLDAPPDSRQVWLPAELAGLTGLPGGLRYAHWDGRSPFPADPGAVEFYVPPFVKDLDVISRPLTRMKRLKAVQALSSGTDGLGTWLRRLPGRVVLCNARGVHARSTAELALALILASLRRIPEFTRAQDRGAWQPAVSRSLYGSSVLVVGYGEIGSALDDLLTPFGCAVTRVARTGRDSPRGPVHPVARLPRLVAGADIVVLTTALTPGTRHLFDAELLARARDGALLVNVARGAVVDTAALLTEVANGRLTAALDVTDPEPLPAGHPLRGTPGVLITPHVGALTSAMWPRLEDLVRRQLNRFASGEELDNVVAY
ncbi:2-hydroxyacid dehydrogenase [Streptomyces yaizuensis]|uniref:2-hydroxyacid dehydrogenase n=1 Tax=Streptomyces yaizuensis TaxID=2989713 RepID=A0ABQ5NYE1_9ACTN|nr:2-hydroxyacid dehydrogenase [Streptomyces sp. YSPA8]GLF95373.1 2-hydroxyacid dehydrogenase [Streptomyces sp. YSPA8]